jgi:succinate dehydrogenase flavin-adding protein (antitoxin of CptAB toxin-antitoxin module)
MGVAVSEYVNATFATLSERERRDLARLLEKLGARISEVAAAHCEPAAGDEEDGR